MIDLSTEEIVSWHRRYCEVTSWLAISGDLSPSTSRAESQLSEWVAHGVTDIVDVRGEWSDERLVAELAPQLRYHHIGTHDDGSGQSVDWFAEGLCALHEALAHEGAKILVHCHMGINRGPSMAFAFLLDQGWDPNPALAALRNARPIAAILYAADAIEAHHELRKSSKGERVADTLAVRQWMSENDIDVAHVIRRIRQAE